MDASCSFQNCWYGVQPDMSKINDYFANERYIRRRFVLLVCSGVLVLMPAALAFGNGLLSSGALASVMLAWVACGAVASFVIVRNIRATSQVSSDKSTETADDATLKKFRKRIGRLQFGVAFFALVLVYGLWETRDDPWPPRLVGATINLLFQTVMIMSIRKMQKQLKQEASGRSQ
jgi:hypothetical protein